MRLDLLALIPVMAILHFIIVKYAKPGKAGKIWMYIMWAAVVAAEIYWTITGVLFGGA